MNIREAKPADFEHLLTFCSDFKTSPFTFDQDFLALSSGEIRYVFAEEFIKSNSSTSLILEEHEGPGGFITVSINSLLSEVLGKKIGSIVLLAVKEPLREKGFGKMLLQKAVSFLIHSGIEIVTVGTDIYNLPAVNLYESNGFRFRMGWHIFRYFRGKAPTEKQFFSSVQSYDPERLALYAEKINRPISLLKEPSIDKNKFHSFLTKNFLEKIKNGKNTALEYLFEEKPVGFININRDEIAEKTLRLKKKVYRILDLIETEEIPSRKIKTEILSDIISRKQDAALFEMWVEAGNADLIKALEEAGFRLSYTGLSFHYS
jgi:ribosomal protein S18 acetylase RimI-like enzyme